MKTGPLNPRTSDPDFFGAPGAFLITVGLPAVVFALYFICNHKGCPAIGWTDIEFYKDQLTRTTLISWKSASVYLAWFSSLAILDRIVPGEVIQGTVLRDGTRLTYKFNGKLVTLLLFVVLIVRWVQTEGAMPELAYIYDHLVELMNVTIIFSFVFATLLYISSFLHSKEPILAEGGNTGNPVFDWFIGRELNPSIGDFDLKVFCEMRPGLLLWLLINLSMAHHQYLTLGHVTDSMILVCLFQGYYVVEGTFYEKGLVSMMDIMTDGFGFMLMFGDLSLVPFTYTLQARYLADHPVHLGISGVIGVLAVYAVGLLIFRLSNNQKNAFKQGHPSTKHLKYIQSETGSKLIISGWWGLSRHINYLGDWIMAWAFSLPTGFNTPIPYYYVLYFAILLIHRERRDEAKCSSKYKKTWQEYKKLVPARIIPGIY